MNEDKEIRGRDYWRSLDQLADTPEFREMMEREFPEGASEINNEFSRRDFLTLMGASMALAGLVSCRRPVERIIPYVAAPEEIVPGIANHYATTMPLGNSAYGLIVESHEGRPTKIEGNPDHPSTMGMSSVHIQSSILDLYDPDRSKSVLRDGNPSEWQEFVEFWKGLYESFSKNGGRGLAVLSEPFSSQSLYRMIGEFKRKFPKARWVAFDPVSDENIYEGTKIASGQSLRPVYNYEKARVILSLDCDFLYGESENITAARGFADGRRLETENDEMNRLYVVESTFTVTGSMADHRMRLRSKLIGSLAAELVRQLTSQGLRIDSILPDISFLAAPDLDRRWIESAARDLLKNKGRCLVVAGRGQPAGVHAMVYAINHALGNFGSTVSYKALDDSMVSSRSELAALCEDMNNGSVDTLVILGGNPVYNAFADLGFEAALSKVANKIHLGSHVDETSQTANWHIPQAHYLESWGDAVSADGTRSIIQPLIAPLFGGKSVLEITNLLVNLADVSGYEIVRKTW